MNDLIKPPADIERRFFAFQGLEVRAASDSEPARLVGYAAVFEELSEPLGGFREKIAPGAFAKSLGGDVRALFNHDPNFVIGRTKAKTLRLQEDSRGLLVEITPPDTSFARDLLTSIARGDVDQMSFGFRTLKDDWQEDEKSGDVIRTLIDVKLFDVSPVTFPAYTQTEIAVRSLDQWKAARTSEPPAVPDYSIERRKLDLLGL